LTTTPLRIRPESVADEPGIGLVITGAFGGTEEAELVVALRRDGDVLYAAVAEGGGGLLGHVLFSRMFIETPDGRRVPAAALAPLAVAPAAQRRGIGEALTRHGLDRLQQLGERIVIVLGHPAYYPRFGFSAALARNIECPFEHRDAFMAMELAPGALDGVRGRVVYARAFGL
jgi:putative acetyltransferase